MRKPEPMENETIQFFRHLYNYAQEYGATEATMELGDVFDDPEAYGVLAVYIGDRPAHHVLRDLIRWAEAMKDNDLLGVIEDMSRPGYVDPWGDDDDD